jgi:hypothetical protein
VQGDRDRAGKADTNPSRLKVNTSVLPLATKVSLLVNGFCTR